VLVTMLVPVGIAYAVASGVPGIYGLYATIVPLLAYALISCEIPGSWITASAVLSACCIAPDLRRRRAPLTRTP
jgi:MFS superfamily sulfate permease-like transporter